MTAAFHQGERRSPIARPPPGWADSSPQPRLPRTGNVGRVARMRGCSGRLCWILGVSLLPGWQSQAGEPSAFPQLRSDFANTIQKELRAGSMSGVSVALVDDQQILWAQGFGFADKKRRRPAQANTVYRAGSISKLFTALAAMQLVEQGKLDIDQPVTRYLPDFRIISPFPDGSVFSLRQLMCHRSGNVRESPVGGYFDDSEPTVAATVASLASCVLVYPPNTKTKYSNSGVTIVGHAVERIAGQPFVEHQEQQLLGPLGMGSSAFRINESLRPRLAKGYLPVADGKGGFREVEAPHFELGTVPAGNLYTTAEDLARFLSFLFAGGRIGGRQLLQPQTLEEMFTPQLTSQTNGFGLGFNVSWFRGHKTVNHMGAVYGFTSLVSGLPREKLGVVVLCNDDIAVRLVRQLGAAGLSLLLQAKLGEAPPPPAPTFKLAASELAAFAGDFESESWWAEIRAGEGVLQANVSGQRATLRPIKTLEFEANGRLADQAPFVFQRSESGRIIGFTALGQKFAPVDAAPHAEISAAWKRFLGRYGPSFIPLIISARHGHLYAMTENEYDNRLTPLNQTVFRMPPGLYTDEQLVFQLDRTGRPHTAVLANMALRRVK